MIRFEDLGVREDALLLGTMLEKQGVKRLYASDALRSAFLQAAASARANLDEKLLPKALVKEAVEVLAEYRSHPRH